jgi:hypothetical protein
MRLGRTLMDHKYIGTLLTLYAHRALGLFGRPKAARDRLLMVITEMIPLSQTASASKKTQRVVIKSLLAVPLAILPTAILHCHAQTQCAQAAEPDRSLVSVCILPTGFPGRCDTRFRLFGPSLPVDMLVMCDFRTTLWSPTFCAYRDVATDLDSLFV